MKARLLVTTGLMAMLWPGVASADNWYISGGLGLGAGSELDVGGYLLPDAKVSPESNWRGMLGAGYDFNNNWRTQLDYVYRTNEYGAIANSGPPGSSDMDSHSVTFSGIYDFWSNGTTGAYVGAGLGWASVDYSAVIANPLASGGSEEIENDDAGLGGHLLAGMAFQLTPALTTDIEYRYFRYGQDTDVPYTGGTAELSPYDSHDVLWSLRYAFLPPMAPPAPPQQAAPPRSSCADVPFTVYFEWDRSDLNDEARQVVDTAVNQLSTCRVAQIEIAGHADRSGSPEYNVGLSERRARVVRDEFVARGIPESEIVIEALGESDPAVDTPDGAREPLNRRAAVVIRVAGGPSA